MKSLKTYFSIVYRDAFNFFDKTKKGYIVAEDFDRALRCIGTAPKEGEVDDLVKEYDINGDGKITFEEMVVVTVKRREYKDSDAEVKKIFKKFDTDHDGVLSRSELVNVLKTIGDKLLVADVEEILADFDENHDGVIQYEGKLNGIKWYL
ncbi:hypothetical protein FSP39_004881 [Pinctada imbricata]|uniref:EF-hand domain-containing protein n=1 Tax=Pinctada imbricata TaxID=66713 RepID=A0AA89BRA7_PINIB|nr:hypothetical protein FSP39_004881 [Pinctada imbricata]